MREPDHMIRLKTVLARTGLSRSTIYRKVTEGTFPVQIRISVNGAGWHDSDINCESAWDALDSYLQRKSVSVVACPLYLFHVGASV
ncbi:helix-turn-helix transcriptional regulator [Rhizobium sullae]|uniref:helix-turn-helix transcriptional regulator n=1 Tax=Rhizobium sullae TaxID=50338 RepID=UPI000B35E29D|nr:AlpA family phage regulatory protein [Rhizobium sullae]